MSINVDVVVTPDNPLLLVLLPTVGRRTNQGTAAASGNPPRSTVQVGRRLCSVEWFSPETPLSGLSVPGRSSSVSLLSPHAATGSDQRGRGDDTFPHP